MTDRTESDDLAYICARIPTYQGYRDEAMRHDTDIRVRAILGESLTDAHVRLGAGFDAEQTAAYDAVLAHCMFGDQAFVKRVEHAELDATTIAALVAADRDLVELEERINDASDAKTLSALVGEVGTKLDSRRDPLASPR